MKIKTVTYGRTIVLDGRHFKQEKVWFGWDAEVDEGEDADKVLHQLRQKADALETEIRRNGPKAWNERYDLSDGPLLGGKTPR